MWCVAVSPAARLCTARAERRLYVHVHAKYEHRMGTSFLYHTQPYKPHSSRTWTKKTVLTASMLVLTWSDALCTVAGAEGRLASCGQGWNLKVRRRTAEVDWVHAQTSCGDKKRQAVCWHAS